MDAFQAEFGRDTGILAAPDHLHALKNTQNPLQES